MSDDPKAPVEEGVADLLEDADLGGTPKKPAVALGVGLDIGTIVSNRHPFTL